MVPVITLFANRKFNNSLKVRASVQSLPDSPGSAFSQTFSLAQYHLEYAVVCQLLLKMVSWSGTQEILMK